MSQDILVTFLSFLDSTSQVVLSTRLYQALEIVGTKVDTVLRTWHLYSLGEGGRCQSNHQINNCQKIAMINVMKEDLWYYDSRIHPGGASSKVSIV